MSQDQTTFLIYGLMVGAIALLVLRRPSVAMGAFLCTYGLEQWAEARSSWFYINSAFTNIITVCVLLWAVVVSQAKGQSVFQGGLPRIFWVIFALFAWSAISLAWTPVQDVAIQNWKSALPYVLATILVMPLLVRNREDLKAAMHTTILLGSVVLLLLLFFTPWAGRNIELQRGVAIGSIKGTAGNPLAVASLAGWVALFALLMNFRGVGRFWQVIRWPIILLGLVVAFKSGSRGQLFALCVAGMAFLPFSRRMKNIGGFLGVCVGIGLMLYLATWAFDQFAWGSGKRWDAENMILNWRGGRLDTSMVLLRAWTAAGPVAWVIGLGSSASYDTTLVGFYPHLVMLEVLGELGIIGFIILWLVPIITFYNYWRIHRLVKDDPVARGVAAAIASLFLFEVILSFKQGSLLTNVFAFGFAVIVGRLAVSVEREKLEGGLAYEQVPYYFTTPQNWEAQPATAFGAPLPPAFGDPAEQYHAPQ